LVNDVAEMLGVALVELDEDDELLELLDELPQPATAAATKTTAATPPIERTFTIAPSSPRYVQCAGWPTPVPSTVADLQGDFHSP
jgi:hypothetical protein